MGKPMAQNKKASEGGRAAAKPVRASAKADASKGRLPSASLKSAARGSQVAAPADAMASGQVASSETGMNHAATTASTGAGARADAVSAAGPLPLGSSLSIREVGERAAQLKALFAAGSAEVDAGKLESVDTAGLQLLLAAAAAARRCGLTLKLLGAERLNTGAAAALGLTEHMAAAAQILP